MSMIYGSDFQAVYRGTLVLREGSAGVQRELGEMVGKKEKKIV
jgi:hypothetical protein